MMDGIYDSTFDELYFMQYKSIYASAAQINIHVVVN